MIETSRLAGILGEDVATGTIRVAAGTSLGDLVDALLPRGMFPAVLPGTRFVSVGGAIAADIHGKNHHRDGTFSRAVTELTLCTPEGVRTVGPEIDPDSFWAATGGMGLTGFILDATLRLSRVESGYVRVDTERAEDIEDLMGRMADRDARYQYSVAWIDTTATRRGFGRGVLSRGNHASPDDLPRPMQAKPLEVPIPTRGFSPPTLPFGAINSGTVRIFNQLWFHKAPREERDRLVPYHAFFWPLDRVQNWNRLYGPRGFVQYQCVVPYGSEATLRAMLQRAIRSGAPSLAVMKRFGPESMGHLSFPLEGWTMALDFPASYPYLAVMLDRFDEQVAEVGGRVYLAKDARLKSAALRSMYPRLRAWMESRGRLDPLGVWRSDLARRLELVG